MTGKTTDPSFLAGIHARRNFTLHFRLPLQVLMNFSLHTFFVPFYGIKFMFYLFSLLLSCYLIVIVIVPRRLFVTALQ